MAENNSKTYYGQTTSMVTLGQVHATGSDGELPDLKLPVPTVQYRCTTLGRGLIETLDKMLSEGKLTEGLYYKTLQKFDSSFLQKVSNQEGPKLKFKGDLLKSYRFLDGLWTFVLHDVEFREHNNLANVDKLKIRAFDAVSNPIRNVPRAVARRRNQQETADPESP